MGTLKRSGNLYIMNGFVESDIIKLDKPVKKVLFTLDAGRTLVLEFPSRYGYPVTFSGEILDFMRYDNGAFVVLEYGDKGNKNYWNEVEVPQETEE